LVPAGEWRWNVALAYENTMAMSEAMLELYADPAQRPADGLVTQDVLEQVAAATNSGQSYYVDGETLRATISGAVGTGHGTELGFTLPVFWHTGGFMDSPIERWHDLWGFPDGGRPEFARDQYVVGYVDGDRSVFLGDAPGGPRPGDLVITGRFALLRGGSPDAAIAAVTELKLPTGSEGRIEGSGAVDGGIGLVGSWRHGRSTLHGGAQVTRIGASDLLPDGASHQRLALFSAWTMRAAERTWIVGQVVTGRGPFPRRDGSDLGDPSIEIAIGARHRAGPAGAFEWALLENLTGRLNTPDVGAYFGWMWCPAPLRTTP
jgi:hypothetical protein